MSFFTTQASPTGNRFFASDDYKCFAGRSGNFAPLVTSHKQEDSRAAWIIGSRDTLHFLMVNDDSSIQRLSFNETLVGNSTLAGEWPKSRPLVATISDELSLLEPFFSPNDDTSRFSSAIPTESGDVLYIREDPDQLMHVNTNGVTAELDDSLEDVLFDGNIAYSQTNKMWAFYSGSTRARYTHGILGDSLEGYKMNVLKSVDDEIRLVATVELPGESLVFEGLSPMWTDIDGDGVEDLLTTIALDGRGAALRVYFVNEDGTVRPDPASSPYIGSGQKWLHQLAVGPMGPNGENEIVEIRTPHIGGHARFYQYNADENNLFNVASTRTFTSHDIGSRNLDQALVGDFNNDGIPEFVVQDQEKNFLYGLQHGDSDGRIDQVWRVELPAPIYSNIGVACSEESGPQLLFSTKFDAIMMRIQFVPTDEPIPTAAASGSTVSWVTTWLLIMFVWWRTSRG